MPKQSRKRRSGAKARRKKLIYNIISAILIVAVAFIIESQSHIFTNFINDNLNGGSEQTGGRVYERAEGDLLVHFVDVGQGDCIIIQLPDGKNMIIDAGPPGGKDNLFAFMEDYGIEVFHYLILTHTDDDHAGNMDDVILQTEVLNMYVPDVSTEVITTKTYANFVSAMEKENAQVNFSTVGTEIDGGSYGFLFFTPTTEMYQKTTKNNINDICPVIIMTYGDRRVMFTGDATLKTEQAFLDAASSHSRLKNEIVDVDVLKVAHHGSNTSSTDAFLAAVKPEYAVIPVGAGNTYGHPTQDVLTKLAAYAGSEIYRTDILGHITLKLSPNENGPADIIFLDTGAAGGLPDSAAVPSLRIELDKVWYIALKRRILYIA